MTFNVNVQNHQKALTSSIRPGFATPCLKMAPGQHAARINIGSLANFMRDLQQATFVET